MTKANEGWKCPVCGKGKAPWASECVHAWSPVPLPISPYGPQPNPWIQPYPQSPFTYRQSGGTVTADSKNTLIFNSN